MQESLLMWRPELTGVMAAAAGKKLEIAMQILVAELLNAQVPIDKF